MSKDFHLLEPRCYLAFGETVTDWSSSGRTLIQPATDWGSYADVEIDRGRIWGVTKGGIVRLKLDGSQDATFGVDSGIALSEEQGISLSIDPQGYAYVLSRRSDGALVRKITPSGKLDRRFGQNGKVLLAASDSFIPESIDAATDRVVIGGVQYKFDATRGGVDEASGRMYRLNADGSANSKFGAAGMIDFNLGLAAKHRSNVIDHVAAVRSLADGSIIVAGGSLTYSAVDGATNTQSDYGKSYLATTKFTASGKRVAAFGSKGIARIPLAGGSALRDALEGDATDSTVRSASNQPIAALVQPDGSVVIAARAAGVYVGRFDPAGERTSLILAETEFELDRPSQIASLPDGRFVIVGQPRAAYANHGPAMAVLSADGEDLGPVVLLDDLDDATRDLSPGYGTALGDQPPAIAIAIDGDILVGGAAADGAGPMIQKFNAGLAADSRPDTFPAATVNDLVQDADGGLHIAYYDSQARWLKYAYRAPNHLWREAITVDASPRCGEQLSIVVDVSGNPTIAYLDGTNADLKVATSVNGGNTFSTKKIERSKKTGFCPSAAYDRNGDLHIAYYRQTLGDLKLATFSKTTNNWSLKTIDSVDDVGRHCDIAAPSADIGPELAIAYFNEKFRTVKYAKLENGSWTTQIAAQASASVGQISLAFGPGVDNPIVTYYDSGAADLKFTLGDGSWASGNSIPLAERGSQGSFNSAFAPGHLQVYSYDKSRDLVRLLGAGGESVTDAQIAVRHGGRYLSVTTASDLLGRRTFAAYLRGDHLLIRSMPSPTEQSPFG